MNAGIISSTLFVAVYLFKISDFWVSDLLSLVMPWGTTMFDAGGEIFTGNGVLKR